MPDSFLDKLRSAVKATDEKLRKVVPEKYQRADYDPNKPFTASPETIERSKEMVRAAMDKLGIKREHVEEAAEPTVQAVEKRLEEPYKIEDIHYLARPYFQDTPIAKAAKRVGDWYSSEQAAASGQGQGPVDAGELDQVSPAQGALDRLTRLTERKKVE